MKSMKFLVQLSAVLLLLNAVACTPYKSALTDIRKDFDQAVKAEEKCMIAALERSENPSFAHCDNEAFLSVQADIDSLIAKYSEPLISDDVLWQALALKSFAAYNAEQNAVAIDAARRAVQLASNSDKDRQARDYFVAQAMPGLVKANELYIQLESINETVSEANYQQAADLAKSALDDLEQVRASAEQAPDAVAYLTTAKLSVYKNWLDILFDTIDRDASDADVMRKRKREDEILAMAKADLLRWEKSGAEAQLLRYWRALLGVGA